MLTFSPANARRSPNVESMLAHRLRRWPNTDPTLGQRLVFAGSSSSTKPFTLHPANPSRFPSSGGVRGSRNCHLKVDVNILIMKAWKKLIWKIITFFKLILFFTQNMPCGA